jgi:integrase
MTNELALTNTALQPVTLPPDRNPMLVYLASLGSAESRRTMRHALGVIAELVAPGVEPVAFPWAALRYQHTTAIRAKLSSSKYSVAGANKMLSALRGVLKEARRLKQISAEDYQDAIDLKPVRGNAAPKAAGRQLKRGELSALMEACTDGTSAGIRDAAIIAVAYTAGLRRGELAGLLLDDWNGDADECVLTVRGKGNKTRVVPLAESACDALADWLQVRGPWAGPLFTRIHSGDHLTMDGMTTQAIYYIMAERAAQAGIKKFSPHDLRRTFAGDLLDAGADLSTVQKLMGHASPTTTAGYDRRDAKAKRAAVNKLHIPYRRQFKG